MTAVNSYSPVQPTLLATNVVLDPGLVDTMRAGLKTAWDKGGGAAALRWVVDFARQNPQYDKQAIDAAVRAALRGAGGEMSEAAFLGAAGKLAGKAAGYFVPGVNLLVAAQQAYSIVDAGTAGGASDLEAGWKAQNDLVRLMSHGGTADEVRSMMNGKGGPGALLHMAKLSANPIPSSPNNERDHALLKGIPAIGTLARGGVVEAKQVLQTLLGSKNPQLAQAAKLELAPPPTVKVPVTPPLSQSDAPVQRPPLPTPTPAFEVKQPVLPPLLPPNARDFPTSKPKPDPKRAEQNAHQQKIEFEKNRLNTTGRSNANAADVEGFIWEYGNNKRGLQAVVEKIDVALNTEAGNPKLGTQQWKNLWVGDPTVPNEYKGGNYVERRVPGMGYRFTIDLLTIRNALAKHIASMPDEPVSTPKAGDGSSTNLPPGSVSLEPGASNPSNWINPQTVPTNSTGTSANGGGSTSGSAGVSVPTGDLKLPPGTVSIDEGESWKDELAREYKETSQIIPYKPPEDPKDPKDKWKKLGTWLGWAVGALGGGASTYVGYTVLDSSKSARLDTKGPQEKNAELLERAAQNPHVVDVTEIRNLMWANYLDAAIVALREAPQAFPTFKRFSDADIAQLKEQVQAFQRKLANEPLLTADEALRPQVFFVYNSTFEEGPQKQAAEAIFETANKYARQDIEQLIKLVYGNGNPTARAKPFPLEVLFTENPKLGKAGAASAKEVADAEVLIRNWHYAQVPDLLKWTDDVKGDGSRKLYLESLSDWLRVSSNFEENGVRVPLDGVTFSPLVSLDSAGQSAMSEQLRLATRAVNQDIRKLRERALPKSDPQSGAIDVRKLIDAQNGDKKQREAVVSPFTKRYEEALAAVELAAPNKTLPASTQLPPGATTISADAGNKILASISATEKQLIPIEQSLLKLSEQADIAALKMPDGQTKKDLGSVADRARAQLEIVRSLRAQLTESEGKVKSAYQNGQAGTAGEPPGASNVPADTTRVTPIPQPTVPIPTVPPIVLPNSSGSPPTTDSSAPVNTQPEPNPNPNPNPYPVPTAMPSPK
jgi:hypothetical protein